MSSSIAEKRVGLNKMNNVAGRFQLGSEVSNSLRCVKGIWSFAQSGDVPAMGGAVGDYSLRDDDGNIVKLPASAIVMNSLIYVKVPCTTGGTPTVDFQIEAANDLVSGTAFSTIDGSGETVQSIPDFATKGDYVVTTAERTLTMSINTAPLTAGKLYCYVFYVLAL
jgi:hypothetical protein